MKLTETDCHGSPRTSTPTNYRSPLPLRENDRNLLSRREQAPALQFRRDDHPLSIPVENLNKQKGCHSGARPPEDITLIFYIRWAVDAIESLCVALRIVKRRPIAPKPFVEILSLTLQNDTTGRMAKLFATAGATVACNCTPALQFRRCKHLAVYRY